jgi:hypothetical protein
LNTFKSLAQAVQFLPSKLSDAQAQAAVESYLAVTTKQLNNYDVAQASTEALRALAARFTDVQTQAAGEAILSAIKRTTDIVELMPLAVALQPIASRLTGAQAEVAVVPVLSAIGQTAEEDFFDNDLSLRVS